MLVEISEQELALVIEHRKNVEAARLREQKIAACPHKVRVYDGHSHNDDAFKCTACGDIEWR